ncbi:hypothetical protein QCD68_13350 [Curtobacterium sp. PsM8]|nr:hypothetical protein [Curtobacterium sp. PsM8]
MDLLFQDDRGPVTLLDLRWAGQHGAPVAVTRAIARSAICQAPRTPSEEKEADGQGHREISQLASTVDGLVRFLGTPPFEVDDDAPEGIVVKPGSVHPIIWTLSSDVLEADIAYELVRSTPWTTAGGVVKVENRAQLLTGYAVDEGEADVLFLLYQQPLRALLVLVYGKDANWRSHEVRGEQYVQRVQDREGGVGAFTEERRWEPAYIDATARWSGEAADLGHPLLVAVDFGAEGFEQWFSRWTTDDDFKAALAPAVEAIAGMTRFLEPRLISLVGALEGLGGWVSGNPRKWITTTSAVQNCLEAMDVDWSNLGTTQHIAGYLGTIYNDLKHAQRGRRSSYHDLRFATRLASTIVRLVAFVDLPIRDAAKKYFAAQLIDALEQEIGQRYFEDFSLPGGNRQGVQLVRSPEDALRDLMNRTR